MYEDDQAVDAEAGMEGEPAQQIHAHDDKQHGSCCAQAANDPIFAQHGVAGIAGRFENTQFAPSFQHRHHQRVSDADHTHQYFDEFRR